MIFQSAVQTCQGRQFQFQNIIYRLQTPKMDGKWPIINKIMCITQMNHVSNLPCHEDSAHIGRHEWCRRPRKGAKSIKVPPSLPTLCTWLVSQTLRGTRRFLWRLGSSWVWPSASWLCPASSRSVTTAYSTNGLRTSQGCSTLNNIPH